MPQINSTISNQLIQALHDHAIKTNQSFSKTASHMIELGLKVSQKQADQKTLNRQEKARELEEKHTEYLLRIININSEILRKLYGKQSQYDTNNADELLQTIKVNVQKYIDEHIGSNE